MSEENCTEYLFTEKKSDKIHGVPGTYHPEDGSVRDSYHLL